MAQRAERLSRRKFLIHSGQAAAGLAGVGVLGTFGRAAGQGEPVPASSAIRLERQSTGSEIWQVTTEQFMQSNIYCELPYCSANSRYFLYERHNPDLPDHNKTELMTVEIGTWRQQRLDVTSGLTGCAISTDGFFYYLKRSDDGALDLMRADLSDGRPDKIYRMEDKRSLVGFGTVSVDARYYACGKRLDDNYRMFGIMLVDLKTGSETIIDRDPFIFNPHTQFDRGLGRELMIQHNRGGEYTPEGKRIRLVGPEGATLYLLSVPDGKRTELQVGKPYTTAATGHETWIGKTKEILLTVMAEGDFVPDKGNLLAVRAGSSPRVVAAGYKFNHLGVSRCGRFFCCDDWQGKAKIVIGSIKSGKTTVLCDSRASMGNPQNTHPHAYLTGDLKWVIFNSDRSGFPHVHAASVPEGMIDELAG